MKIAFFASGRRSYRRACWAQEAVAALRAAGHTVEVVPAGQFRERDCKLISVDEAGDIPPEAIEMLNAAVGARPQG